MDGGNNDDHVSDDLDLGHCCPALITLAVVLMEIYFVKPFKKLADVQGTQLIETPSGRIVLPDVDQVFNGYEDMGKEIEEWRSQMQEDYPLIAAIDNLDVELWENEEGRPLEGATLRSRIYDQVVRLLELHLSHGFSQIPLDAVDQ